MGGRLGWDIPKPDQKRILWTIVADGICLMAQSKGDSIVDYIGCLISITRSSDAVVARSCGRGTRVGTVLSFTASNTQHGLGKNKILYR